MKDMDKIVESVAVALGAEIVELKGKVAFLEWKVEDAKKDNEKLTTKNEALKKEIAELEDEMAELAEKLYLALERNAIQTESDAPCPVWDIEPKPKEVAEVTETTNVSKVIIEEDVE